MQQSYEVSGLDPCTQYYFAVKLVDATGNSSALGDTAINTTACGGGGCSNPPCQIERPGQKKAVVGREEDLALRLEGAIPNPSRGAAVVEWSIPQRLSGAPFELSLYDVAGRRLRALAAGTATAGRFTQGLSFHSGEGGKLPNGVFFLRLVVGNEVLKRTVVLTQ